MKNISSGIQGLDHILCGGFPKGRSILLTGDSGTGKTTAGIQFLLEGVKKGEDSVFITFNSQPKQIIENAKGLNWDLEKYMSHKLFHFIDGTQESSLSQNNSNDFEIMWSKYLDYMIKHQICRLVIDPFVTSKNYPNLRLAIRKIILNLDQLDFCTSLIIITTQPHEYIDESAWCSGRLDLSFTQQPYGTTRELFIQKMSGLNVNIGKYRYFIEEDTGLNVKSYSSVLDSQ